MSPAAATFMPNLAGHILERRWQLLKMLGSGSYGVVYEAVDLHPRAPMNALRCAIKIISKAGRRPAEIIAVHEEVRLHSLVSKHPNIVDIHHAFEDSDYFYLVLGLCRGGDLFTQVCVKGTYADNDILLRKAFLSLIDAVRTCHECEVFHRDLKPENILTNEDGSQVYLADFGLATHHTISNEHGCGTARYMSPECAGRMTGLKPYCTRFSDIWALGIILINMIGGLHPWSIASLEDYCFARFVEDPSVLRKIVPANDKVNAILQNILSLNPLDRMTLDELRQAILELDTFFISEDEAEAYAETDAALLEYSGASGSDEVLAAVFVPPVEMDISETVRTDPTTPMARHQSTRVFNTHIAGLTSQGNNTFDSDGCSSSDMSFSSEECTTVVTPETTSLRSSEYEEKDIGEMLMQRSRERSVYWAANGRS